MTLDPIPSSPEHTRTISLEYSAPTSSCTAGHAPYRALKNITESAVGVDSPAVTLPPLEFEYGSAEPDYPFSPQVENVPWPGGLHPNFRNNLGWGYRFIYDDEWPTVEAMMLDIDGDGLIDRLVSEPAPHTSGAAQFCQARWYRNTGQGFQNAGLIAMPTLKWATEGNVAITDPFAGGPYAGSKQGAKERCALNYQRTAYRNSIQSGAGFSCHPYPTACPASGYCEGPGITTTRNDCTTKVGDPEDTIFAWRWFDIDGDSLPDLIGSPVRGGLVSYDLQWGSVVAGVLAPQEPFIFGVYPACPSPTFTASTNPSGERYTMCGGMFPWFVYKNHGNGVFGSSRLGTGTHPHETWGPLPDRIIYQPVPLETSNGESSMTSRPMSEIQGIIDIDGDGFVDAVRRTGSNTWSVYKNDGSGVMEPIPSTSTPYSFSTGNNFSVFRTDLSIMATPVGIEGLLDLNGDGLPDHWDRLALDEANVHLNGGDHFRLGDSLTVDRPGPDGSPLIEIQTGNPSYWVCRGRRSDSRRVIDVDGDGRGDLGSFASGITNDIQFNVGGRFGSAAGAVGYSEGLQRYSVVHGTAYPATCDSSTFYWELRSDLIDLDGDGIPESVNFGPETIPASTMSVSRITTPSQPPRLLVRIDNHRGAETSISYSPMRAPTVEQNPHLGKAMPHTGWVVQSTTTADQFAGTTSTTSYKYISPRFHKDERGSYGFRGFDEVHTTAPSGALTIERYSYSPDWSGRLAATIVKPSTASTEVTSVDETTWEERTLFAGLIKTYHATISDHWTCKNGQDEAACRANTDTRTRKLSSLDLLTSTTTTDPTPLMWQETRSGLQSGVSPSDGDRFSQVTFALASDAATYRLRPLRTTKEHLSGGSMVLYGQSRTRWDATFRVPEFEDVWFSTNGDMTNCLVGAENCATTAHEFDMTTGNLIKRWKPEQHANVGPASVMTYDARKLFVASEINEKGHVVEYSYEYGTGTKLRTAGPNVAACTTNNTCPTGTEPKEEQRIRVDGLGRMIERWQTFSQDGNSYTSTLVETNSYIDEAVGAVPPSITHQSAIDTDSSGTVFSMDKTEFDGDGRPTKKIVYVFGSAPADQITTFTYGNDGTLREVRLPDPSKNDASLVTYTYGYDSLGRPTSMRRPDASSPGAQSGVDITYDGLVTTSDEVVGTAGGNAASTRTTKDAFGRLRVVEEKDGTTWRITTYDYDPNDNVETIVGPGPDYVTTELHHDFASRRVEIDRHGRTWKYGYDRNGNTVTETSPCEPVGTCEPSYTTLVEYDDLDRPLRKYPAPRDLAPADIDLFGLHHEYYLWDYGVPFSQGNYIGRLSYWRAYSATAETASTLRLEANPTYNAQGLTRILTQRLKSAGYDLSRRLVRDYTLGSAPSYTHYQDYIGPTTGYTTSRIAYDRRGLPSAVTLHRVGSGGQQQIAVQTRNVAGLVTKRRTDLTGPMTFVESDWTYDVLGRVADQSVQKGPGPTEVARQSMVYFGNDNPAIMEHFLGAAYSGFVYEYDTRHQLVGVSTNHNEFTAAYTYNEAGRFQSVLETGAALPGSTVVLRDVDYEYSGTDPEQVTALVDTTSTFASYAYDWAGNQTIRCYGTLTGTTCSGEATHYLYDGKNQMRRATKVDSSGNPIGSEEYWYDNTGARTQVVKRDASGTKTEMIWFISDVQAHYDGAGNITRIYSHVSLGTPVARVERTSATSAALELQFHGLANSTLAAVAEDGTINASFSYAPFGELIQATDGGAPSAGIEQHRRQFNDKYIDDISGLSYYGFRYYDRTSMTWTQADPLYRIAPDLSALTGPRRANLYQFSLNNPIRYMDPDGLDVSRFFGASPPGTVGAAGDATLGGGWGQIGGPGETLTNNKRRLQKMGDEASWNYGAAGSFDPGPCGGGLCEMPWWADVGITVGLALVCPKCAFIWVVGHAGGEDELADKVIIGGCGGAITRGGRGGGCSTGTRFVPGSPGAPAAVPLLTPGPGGLMLKQALGILKATPASERAALAGELIAQIEARSFSVGGAAWRATEIQVVGGARAWMGETHTLVIDTVGKVFVGPHVNGAVQVGVVDGMPAITWWGGLRPAF